MYVHKLCVSALMLTRCVFRTEVGPVIVWYPKGGREPMDWDYMEFRYDFKYDMRPVDNEGVLRELVVLVSVHHASFSLLLIECCTVAGYCCSSNF